MSATDTRAKGPARQGNVPNKRATVRLAPLRADLRAAGFASARSRAGVLRYRQGDRIPEFSPPNEPQSGPVLVQCRHLVVPESGRQELISKRSFSDIARMATRLPRPRHPESPSAGTALTRCRAFPWRSETERTKAYYHARLPRRSPRTSTRDSKAGIGQAAGASNNATVWPSFNPSLLASGATVQLTGVPEKGSSVIPKPLLEGSGERLARPSPRDVRAAGLRAGGFGVGPTALSRAIGERPLQRLRVRR
jgi:hypothetical protein